MTTTIKTLGNVGLIGRFKPLHNGGAVLLEAACKQAAYVTIGLGSVNKYNMRNPFTAEESEAMIHAFLGPKYKNYRIVKVPDFGHIPEYADGQKWKQTLKETFGELDFFISGNDYVRNLIKDTFKLLHPGEIIPRKEQIYLRATEVRVELAQGDQWKALVPQGVATFIEEKGLAERFRKEFGLATLTELIGTNYQGHENARTEQLHVQEK